MLKKTARFILTVAYATWLVICLVTSLLSIVAGVIALGIQYLREEL